MRAPGLPGWGALRFHPLLWAVSSPHPISSCGSSKVQRKMVLFRRCIKAARRNDGQGRSLPALCTTSVDVAFQLEQLVLGNVLETNPQFATSGKGNNSGQEK